MDSRGYDLICESFGKIGNFESALWPFRASMLGKERWISRSWEACERLAGLREHRTARAEDQRTPRGWFGTGECAWSWSHHDRDAFGIDVGAAEGADRAFGAALCDAYIDE
jgi:hypothetical protein